MTSVKVHKIDSCLGMNSAFLCSSPTALTSSHCAPTSRAIYRLLNKGLEGDSVDRKPKICHKNSEQFLCLLLTSVKYI